jgi:hypothetical protein
MFVIGKEWNMEFKDLDTTFDDSLKKLEGEGMKWYPWVGKEYATASPRLLVLGESHYEWDENDKGAAAKKRLNDPYYNRESIQCYHGINHGKLGAKIPRFYRNAERLLFQKPNPTAAATDKFWRRVAYFNLVQVPMGDRKARPEPSDIVSGWRVTLKICGAIKPTHVLVCGSNQYSFNELKNLIKSDGRITCERTSKPIGRVAGRYLKASISSTIDVSFVFVRHPAAYFNWRRWGDFVKEQTPELLEP